MSANVFARVGAVAAGLSCLLLGVALAQQQTDTPGQVKSTQYQDRIRQSDTDRAQSDATTGTDRRYTANFRGTQATGKTSQSVEKFFADCLLQSNKAEIDIAQLAVQQSQNPQVKQFAQELVSDHQQVAQKLQQIVAAGQRGDSDSTNLRPALRPQSDRPATDAARIPGSTATDSAQADRAGTDRSTMRGSDALNQVAAVERKIKEQCHQALREELQQKSGAEFDACFIGSQVAGHMQMVAALEVLSQEGPGQLKQIASNAKPKVQQHLEKAKQLMKQMESGREGSPQAQRTSTTETQR